MRLAMRPKIMTRHVDAISAVSALVPCSTTSNRRSISLMTLPSAKVTTTSSHPGTPKLLHNATSGKGIPSVCEHLHS